ncbi:hypothetical protein E2C01_039968 [Portunus trituberculatus]|uniref:Uncharacterized protein n=1 Tax=Portunus trituberculatus TaxID=210409 RepID=A0A5B7FPG1_PORTR|nr:hypothetical protein [Portunus trituberculatus]
MGTPIAEPFWTSMALNDRLTGRIVTLAFVFALFAITLWHLLYQSQYDVFNLVPSPLYAFGVWHQVIECMKAQHKHQLISHKICKGVQGP